MFETTARKLRLSGGGMEPSPLSVLEVGSSLSGGKESLKD